jgi:hypothetical protein
MGKLLLIAVLAASLSGCGRISERISDYYISRAAKTAALENPSRAELERAFSDLEKSLEYRPLPGRALETLTALAAKAGASGFSSGLDREIAILKRSIGRDLSAWPALAALISDLAVRGDLFSLNELAARLEAAANGDAPALYEYYAALASGYAAMVPWVESGGYLSLNKSPEDLIEKAREYARVRRRAEELRDALGRIDAMDPARRSTAPEALLSASEVALADLARSGAEAERMYAAARRLDSNPAFLKAVTLTMQGNAALLNKDYPGARAFYRSALKNYPGLFDAGKQLVEADFQEGAGLALSAEGLKAGQELLQRAYIGSGGVIEAGQRKPNLMPFLTRDKYLSDAYAVKAAAAAALTAIERPAPKRKAVLEREFRSALDEAVRLNPQGRLVREMLERYSKEGL